MPTSEYQLLGWRVCTQPSWASSTNGEKAGRWHYAGTPLLYVASTVELAVLEALVHHHVGATGYWLCRVSLRGNHSGERVHLTDLSENWRHRRAETRSIGDTWLKERRSLLLRVPSAVCPSENILLNPSLVDPYYVAIDRVQRFKFDRRLVIGKRV